MTPEQEAILKDVYKYNGAVVLTDEEKAHLRDMFSTPERFTVLRKVLNVFTNAERDIVLPSEEIGISEDGIPADFAHYGQKVYVNALADEKIRKALLSVYSSLQAFHKTVKQTEFEEEVKAEKEEEETREKLTEEEELAKQRVGENI